MKKLVLFILLLITTATAPAAMTYGPTYFRNNFQYQENTPRNPIYLFMDEIDDLTGGGNFYAFNPTTAPASPGEGDTYYDSATKAIKYYNGSTWITLGTTASGTSLDGSYDLGYEITVDGSAVTLTIPNNASNAGLVIANNDATNDPYALQIVQGAGNTGTAVLIDSVSGGTDIEGDSWSVSQAGVITAVGATLSDDVLFDSTYDAAWDASRNQFILQTSAVLGFGGAHDAAALMTFTQDGTNLLIEAATQDSGAVKVGATNSMDWNFYGNTETKIASFDSGAAELILTDYDITATDNAYLNFGTHKDFAVQSATTATLTITPLATDETPIINVGANQTGINLKLFGATTGSFVQWDASTDTLKIDKADIAFSETDGLLFGDTLGTGDFRIDSTDAVLTIAQIVEDAGTIVWGADDAGIDQTWHGESASAYMKWDGTGADQLQLVGVDSSGTLLAITGVDTTGNSDTVTIAHSGSGDAIQITNGSTTSVSLRSIAKAAQTTSSVVIDASTYNANLNDDVGLLQLTSDTAYAHAGATSLLVQHVTGQPVSAAEGFLARFVSTGTAQTNAHAVEIETTNTQPALKLNNQLTITGADSAGTLVAITGADAAGDSDTMTISHTGDGDAIQVTVVTATGSALNLIGSAAQTASIAKIDGATGADWRGADGVGMLSLVNDGTAAHANASLLRIAQSGTSASGQSGICAYLADTTTSGGGTPYVVYISSTNNEAIHVASGKVLVDESVVATTGLQTGVAQTLKANSDNGVGSTVVYPATVVNVTSVNAGVTDWILLPNDPPIGTVVKVLANANSNFEVRTLTAGNDKINNVDCSDGATEYEVTDTDMVIFTYVNSDNWQGVSYPLAGGVSAAVTPD